MLAEDSNIMYQNGPSLSICTLLSRVQLNNALVAIAPKNEDDDTLIPYVAALAESLVNNCSEATNATRAVKQFSSESAINSYVTNKDYDDIDYKDGKIALAVILNKVDVASVQWDYSIRANYTLDYNMDEPTVTCLYNGYIPCAFTYNIPTTKYSTMDLLKPQSAEYMYGYTFTGFSTLQVAVDEFILSQYSSEPVNIRASIGLMPTKQFQTDDFQYVISSVLGIFFILSFLYPVSRIIRALVLEKELRIKEGKRIIFISNKNASYF